MKEENQYKMGMCDIFAFAIKQLIDEGNSKIKKGEIYVVRGYYKDLNKNKIENAHVIVKIGKNKYLDVEGVKNKKDLINSIQFENIPYKIRIIKPSQNKKLFLISSKGIDEFWIEEAIDFIYNRWKYKKNFIDVN